MTLPESRFLPSKVRHALAATFLGLFLIAIPLLMSCAGTGCMEKKRTTNEKGAQVLFVSKPRGARDSVRVRLSMDKRYEWVFVPDQGDGEADDQDAPHRTTAPPEESLGARRLATFRILQATSPGPSAAWAHLLEWPVNAHRPASFSISESSFLELKSSKVYEFARFTLQESYSARATMHHYHQVLTQVLRQYGGAYPLTLLDMDTAVDGKKSHSGKTIRPLDTHQRLIEWASLTDRERLLADATYRSAALPLRDQALERSDSVLMSYIPTLPE